MSGTPLVVGVERDEPRAAVADQTRPVAVPQDDPIAAQVAVCQVIAQWGLAGLSESSQLDDLSTLEPQARRLTELLLSRYVEGNRQFRAFDWTAWRAAMELSRCFFQAYEGLLHYIRSTTDDPWAEHESSVLARLFHHRKIELLLLFLRYKKRNFGEWKQLHEMYGLALERGLANCTEVIAAAGRQAGTDESIERQYLQILLLETMNSGHFSPREALWAHRWFERWCSVPGLRLIRIDGNARGEAKGFAVDLGGSEGLRRMPVRGSDLLYLDSSPLCAMIEQEMVSLKEGAELPHPASSVVRSGQLALLGKLAMLFAPNPGVAVRRTERNIVDLKVQVIAGLTSIVEELRQNGHKQNGRPSSVAAADGDITLSPFGRSTLSPAFAGAVRAGPSSSGRSDTLPRNWQIKDRSGSGCRMRGQIDDLNRVIPGSLVVHRDNETAPWTVSVVRWLRRLMVEHVEIGVEYLGRNPRYMKMVAGDDGKTDRALPASAASVFSALYLPSSEAQPALPIKTLLVPASRFRAGSEMTLLSSNATYRVRLNEPIHQQIEFVLASFAVIEKMAPLAPRDR